MHVDSQKVYLRLGLGPISRRSFWFDSSEGPRKESALGQVRRALPSSSEASLWACIAAVCKLA